MLQMSGAIVCALGLLSIACGVYAQPRSDYPKRPVRFIVAQTPGGNADFVGRIIAEALGKRLGQQFVVDNRAGASGIIATEITAKAPPDVAWQGLLAPRATPAALIQLIHRETVAVINQPEARKQLAAEGGEAVGNTPEEFARWLKAEIAKWTKVVREANIRVE